MSWENTYIELAEQFDATISDRPDEIKWLEKARFTIIDIRSDSFTDEDGNDIGTEAVNRLLPPMDLLYRQAKQHYSYDGWRNPMVSEINKFTVDYFGNLTTFVSGLPWPGGCVPYYWSVISDTDSNVDITEWTVCIS